MMEQTVLLKFILPVNSFMKDISYICNSNHIACLYFVITYARKKHGVLYYYFLNNKKIDFEIILLICYSNSIYSVQDRTLIFVIKFIPHNSCMFNILTSQTNVTL